MSNLELSKANRTKVINSFPTRETGKEGDIIISKIKGKGYFLCTKVGNAWYSSNKLNELKRLTSPKLQELEVDSLKVNNLRIKKQPVNGEISLSKGNLTLDVEGDIELNADGGDITFKDDTAALATINGTGLKIDNISGSSSSTSFLTENSGVVEKRTIPGLGVITALNNATENELVTVGSTTTELDAESKLIFDASTALFTVTGSTTIDKNVTATTTSNNTAFTVDFDQTGIAASMQALSNIGFDLDMNCESVTHVGSVINTGIDIDMVAATDGFQSNTGININTSGGDFNLGLSITSTGNHIKLISSANTSDYFNIAVGAEGATTLSTVDADTVAGHLTLDVDGDLKLNPSTGMIKFYQLGETDLCTLSVAANGVTTIATTDSDGTAGHLTLDIDGNIELNADGGDITFKGAGVYVAKIGERTYFYNPDDAGDFFRISVGNRGQTAISTEDSTDNDAGHMVLEPEGDVIINSKTGSLKFYKQGNLNDTAKIDIGANGDLTILTLDAAGADADITLTADGAITLDAVGDIELNADGGTIVFKDDTRVLGNYINPIIASMIFR